MVGACKSILLLFEFYVIYIFILDDIFMEVLGIIRVFVNSISKGEILVKG